MKNIFTITLAVAIIFFTTCSMVKAEERKITNYSIPTAEWTEAELWEYIGTPGVICTNRKRALGIIWRDKLQACADCPSNNRDMEHVKALRDAVIRKLLTVLSNTSDGKKCFYFKDSFFHKGVDKTILK